VLESHGYKIAHWSVGQVVNRIDDLTYGQLWDYLAELKEKYESEGER
jgi:hypothetical protein